MLAINRRLARLLAFIRIYLSHSFDEADSTQALADATHTDFDTAMMARGWHMLGSMPRLQGGTEWDQGLVTTIVFDWNPALNAVIQKRARHWEKTAHKLVSQGDPEPEAVMKFSAQALEFFFEVMSLRPLTKEEIERCNEIVAASVRVGEDPTAFIDNAIGDGRTFVERISADRLVNLMGLHCELASAFEWAQWRWEEFRRLQLKTATAHFPYLARYDKALLDSLVAWRRSIHERVVLPALDRGPSRAGGGAGDQRLRNVLALAEGALSW